MGHHCAGIFTNTCTVVTIAWLYTCNSIVNQTFEDNNSVTVVSLPSGTVTFWSRGTTYQNNSIINLENIGDGENSLLCLTNLTACCRQPYTNATRMVALGNWFFPNGTRVPSIGVLWDIHRTRDHMRVPLQRRRGGVNGIYSCVIPDAMNVAQTIYIGLYSAYNGAGEWYT